MRLVGICLSMTLTGLPLASPIVAGDAFAGDKVPRMELSDLLAMTGSPDLVILDVRRGKDFVGGERTFKHTTRRPCSDVDSRAGEPDQDKGIVLKCACTSEYARARVARELMKKGGARG